VVRSFNYVFFNECKQKKNVKLLDEHQYTEL